MGREIGDWRVNVSYLIVKRFDLDKVADKTIGKRHWASGSGFGRRDLSYDFKDEFSARIASEKIKKDQRFQVLLYQSKD